MQTATPIKYEEYKAAKDICKAATCQERQRIDAPDEEVGEFVIYFDRPNDPVSNYKFTFIDTTTEAQGFYTFASSQSEYTVVSSGSEYTVGLPSPEENSSPFDMLDEKLPSEEKAKKFLKYLVEYTETPFAQEISNRLNELIEELEADPDEEPLSFESLRSFVSFIRNTRNLKYPDIVLTPTNEICAQWRTAPNRHFAVIFRPTGDAQFVIFKPRPKEPDKVDRLSGTTSIDLLMETVKPYSVHKWTCK